jgi:hypothetical protein
MAHILVFGSLNDIRCQFIAKGIQDQGHLVTVARDAGAIPQLLLASKKSSEPIDLVVFVEDSIDRGGGLAVLQTLRSAEAVKAKIEHTEFILYGADESLDEECTKLNGTFMFADRHSVGGVILRANALSTGKRKR